jgi:phage shock protein E
MTAEKKSFLAANLPLVVVALIALMLGGLIFLSRGLEPDGRGSVTLIDNDGLRELVADGARLLDIRTAGEYEQGHIPDSELVELMEVASVADGWDRSRPVVVYCANGPRSSDAAEVLAGMGFEVYDLPAGIIEWDGELSTGPAPVLDGGDTGVSPSGLPVMYEFSTDS